LGRAGQVHLPTDSAPPEAVSWAARGAAMIVSSVVVLVWWRRSKYGEKRDKGSGLRVIYVRTQPGQKVDDDWKGLVGMRTWMVKVMVETWNNGVDGVSDPTDGVTRHGPVTLLCVPSEGRTPPPQPSGTSYGEWGVPQSVQARTDAIEAYANNCIAWYRDNNR